MGKKEEESFFSLDSILRVLCCRKTRTINTENIDKIKKIHDDIKHGVDSSRDLTFMSRSTRFDLCVWSNQILKCLSEIKDDRETKKQTEELIKHLETMRSFYKTVEKLRAYEIKNVNELFVDIQYYECIMSLAFIIFQEYPKTISAISSQLTRVEQMLTKSGQSSAPRKIRLSNESANEVDDAIEFVDAKIGEFGLVSIAEFIADIIEVFCQYVGGRMDLERTNIGLANEFLGKLLAAIGPKLNAVNSEYDSPEKRLSNWTLLPLSQRIQARADRLESGSATVRRLMFSFERFYKSMIRLGDDFDKMFRRFNGMKFENVDDEHAMMDEEARRMKNGVSDSHINAEKPPSRKSSHERIVKNGEILEDQMSKLILRFDPSRVELPYNVEMFMEVEKIGRSIQKIEAIVSTLIMWFKNEEHIINPLIGHLDECTRIVEKYIRLNVVYKLVYGSNFLSKLKIVYARIESLMETSRVSLSSSREINAEFKRSFPELVYTLYDSFLNAKAKAQPKENSKRSLVQVEDIVNQVLSNSFQSQSHFF